MLRERRVFIGWPAWNPGVERDRHQLRAGIIDLRCDEAEWRRLYAGLGPDRRNYQTNRNFVHDVEPGAIALVPRPALGVVYAGRVVEGFDLVDDPPWADDYLALRRTQGQEAGNEPDHVADVAQCCRVDRFRALPFPLFPAWIRRSLLGRSTFGRVKPMPQHGLDPFEFLDKLLDNPARASKAWTTDLPEVGRRLIDAVGPNTFEHLCVALLQLEEPGSIWAHVGGSGDGGVDGIGADQDGAVVGVLQCKWAYWGGPVFDRATTSVAAPRRILASLLHPEGMVPGDGVEFLNQERISSLVVKHAHRLPLALTLRVGAGVG